MYIQGGFTENNLLFISKIWSGSLIFYDRELKVFPVLNFPNHLQKRYFSELIFAVGQGSKKYICISTRCFLINITLRVKFYKLKIFLISWIIRIIRLCQLIILTWLQHTSSVTLTWQAEQNRFVCCFMLLELNSLTIEWINQHGRTLRKTVSEILMEKVYIRDSCDKK